MSRRRARNEGDDRETQRQQDDERDDDAAMMMETRGSFSALIDAMMATERRSIMPPALMQYFEDTLSDDDENSDSNEYPSDYDDEEDEDDDDEQHEDPRVDDPVSQAAINAGTICGRCPVAQRGQNCSICYEKCTGRSNVRTITGCGHFFHQKCIDEWLRRSRRCPLCNFHLVETDQAALRRAREENQNSEDAMESLSRNVVRLRDSLSQLLQQVHGVRGRRNSAVAGAYRLLARPQQRQQMPREEPPRRRRRT